MRIEHIAIWVKDLEVMKQFYADYFGATSNELYSNPRKQFTSYFLSFDSGCRLELMHNPNITKAIEGESLGLTHLAIALYDKSEVDALTKRLRNDGYQIVGEPRTTGDGYYESVVLDPEGNRVEVTC